MNTKLLFLLLSVIPLASACGDKKDSDKSTPAPKDLHSSVNTKIPEASKAILNFETRTLEERGTTATVAAPVGWASDTKGFEGSLAPPSKDGDKFKRELGFMTKFSIGTTCDGKCEPKNWKEMIDQKISDRYGFPEEAKSVVKVEELPNNGQIMYASWDESSGKRGKVWAAWFTEGASKYKICSANLDHTGLAESLDAFVEACKTVHFK